MSELKTTRLAAQKPHQALSPERKRFNTLGKQIAKARKDRLSWQSKLPYFRAECINTIGTARKSYEKTRREIAFAMGRILDQVKLSQELHDDLTQCLMDCIQTLTERSPMDEELKKLFDKHSSVTFDQFNQAQDDLAKSFVSELTGQRVDEKREGESHDDYMDRLIDHLREEVNLEKERRQAEKAAKVKSKKTKPALAKQEELNAQNALKEVFRKLVSAVHPDREQNPKERARKTELMQEINRAYANNELMTLLLLQLEIEQVDQSDFEELASEKLNAYNKLLASQLKREREATQEELDRFSMENNLPRINTQVMKSDDVRAVIKHIEYAIEEEVEILLDELEFLYGVKKSSRQLKVWIYHQLHAMQESLEDFDG